MLRESNYHPGGTFVFGGLHDTKAGHELFVIHTDIGTAFGIRAEGPPYQSAAEFVHNGVLYRMEDETWRDGPDFMEMVVKWMRQKVPVA